MSIYDDKCLYPDESSPQPDDDAFVWGIITTDNFARENVGDKWLFYPFLTKGKAEGVCEVLR